MLSLGFLNTGDMRRFQHATRKTVHSGMDGVSGRTQCNRSTEDPEKYVLLASGADECDVALLCGVCFKKGVVQPESEDE